MASRPKIMQAPSKVGSEMLRAWQSGEFRCQCQAEVFDLVQLHSCQLGCPKLLCWHFTKSRNCLKTLDPELEPNLHR